MDFFDIKCFLSAAKYLNFSLAAKEMFISQPAMSVKINAVEKDLGVKLFNRNSHMVELTPAGMLAYKELPSVLNRYERVKTDVRSMSISANDHLSISYNGPTEWASIHKLIQAFHLKYPQIDLEIKIERWGQLVSELLNGNLDLIFTERSEILDIPEIESVYLFRDYTALAVSKANPLAKYEKIDLEALINKTSIIKNKDLVIEGKKSSAKSMQRIYERLDDAGLDMKNAKLVDNYEIAIAMASSNIAVAPIPRSFKIKGNLNVNYVDIDSDKAYLDFCLAWSNKNEKPAIGLFSDFCKQCKW